MHSHKLCVQRGIHPGACIDATYIIIAVYTQCSLVVACLKDFGELFPVLFACFGWVECCLGPENHSPAKKKQSIIRRHAIWSLSNMLRSRLNFYVPFRFSQARSETDMVIGRGV